MNLISSLDEGQGPAPCQAERFQQGSGFVCEWNRRTLKVGDLDAGLAPGEDEMPVQSRETHAPALSQLQVRGIISGQSVLFRKGIKTPHSISVQVCIGLNGERTVQ